MKKNFTHSFFVIFVVTMLPQCKSTENQFTVKPDQPLIEFSQPTNIGGGGNSSSPFPTDNTFFGDSNGSNNSELSNISSPELREFMISEGNPNEWNSVSFERVQKIAEFFCSDCHTASVWYGDSSTREFYTTGKVTGRVQARTMPTPATPYLRLMDEANNAGFDYRAAMIKYISER